MLLAQIALRGSKGTEHLYGGERTLLHREVTNFLTLLQ